MKKDSYWKEAERILSQNFIYAIGKFNLVQTFKNTALFSLEQIKLNSFSEALESINEFLENSQYNNFFINKQEFIENFPDRTKFAEYSMKKDIIAYNNYIAEACIIFTHSILNSVVYSFCRVLSLIVPNKWEYYVEKKKIQLLNIKDNSYDKILQEKVKEYINQLERESILRKIDIILEICKYKEGINPDNKFNYNRERIKKFNDLRNNIVHEKSQLKNIQFKDDDLRYIQGIVVFLTNMISLKFNIKIDPYVAFKEMGNI